jgi:hypothetical protein
MGLQMSTMQEILEQIKLNNDHKKIERSPETESLLEKIRNTPTIPLIIPEKGKTVFALAIEYPFTSNEEQVIIENQQYHLLEKPQYAYLTCYDDELRFDSFYPDDTYVFRDLCFDCTITLVGNTVEELLERLEFKKYKIPDGAFITEIKYA